MSRTALVPVLFLLAATGCSSEPDQAETIEGFSLFTHCGVLSAYIQGELWIATEPRPSGFDDSLVGWDENDTIGTMVIRGDRATFVAATSGVEAEFRPADPGETDPAEGCE